MRNFSSRGGLGDMGRNRATVVINGPVRFADVAGIEEEKEEVQEIVQFLRNPRKFLDLGARIPKGFLLVGAPGTGKTLLAKAIAGEANVPFFSLSGSDFSEMLVGVGPRRMRDLFDQAKAYAASGNGAIIFIDEIDSIARMRGVGVSGVSDENEQTLNQLLVQMDGFTKSEGVIVLAATNRPDVLDQALLRPGRFDRQIIVQMPDVRGREKILEVHCKHKPIGSDVDLKRIAKIISGFSGADIENLMNESAIIAAKKNKTRINMADITEGINKVLLGPQKRSRIITDDDKKITAYHEAGHAVISRVLQKNQIVQEVSIIPRGMAAGYTLTNDKDSESHHKSRSFLNTELAVYMGGRTAEEIFIGDICTGSSNDLKVATNLAEKMVTAFGMSDKLGPLFYGKEEEIALRMYNSKNHSESLQSSIDNEVKAIILAAEKQSKEILKANAAKVTVMANILLARETIYADDINLIMDGKDEKTVIAEMEKRDAAAKTQEKKDKAESDLADLEKKLQITHEMAKTYMEAKIIDMEKMVKLEENMKLCREMTSNGNRPNVMPSLDNIDTYANLVKPKESEIKPAPEKQAAAKQSSKGTTPKPRKKKDESNK
ncbi:metalloprotease m41 ftsh [Holotrichia oblita]|nr:metalloprotease m41 ftsh [Holotrichia oblita]